MEPNEKVECEKLNENKIGTKFLMILVLLLTCLCIYYHLSIYSLQNNVKLVQTTSAQKGKEIHINFYNNHYGYSNRDSRAAVLGRNFLQSLHCPVTNCIFSHKRNHLPKITDYDAIVFYVSHKNEGILPPERGLDQIYIMATQESPLYLRQHAWPKEKNVFNMTMTYRLDSDIFYGFNLFEDIQSRIVSGSSTFPVWRIPETVTDQAILNITKSKSKMASCMVSQCNMHSGRDQLTKKLQEYIDVDIYGQCGTLQCPQNNKYKCLEMLKSTYRFYLAFENSLCVDYVTEMIFDALKNYAIPIVFNGANMKRFLPPHSFIDINDFKSFEDLAKHLKDLSENPQEYADYFWWTKYYRIVGNERTFCELCIKLNDWNSIERRQIYYDVQRWFSHSTCKEGIKYS